MNNVAFELFRRSTAVGALTSKRKLAPILRPEILNPEVRVENTILQGYPPERFQRGLDKA